LEDPAPELHSAIPVEQGEMETVSEAVINRQLAGSPTPFLFTHIKRVAAIIAGLSFLLVGLWFGISTRHTPQSRYPYYDTQKPVPQWSEPMPLKGNLRNAAPTPSGLAEIVSNEHDDTARSITALRAPICHSYA